MVLLLAVGGCVQSNEIVAVTDAPSYMLRIGRVAILDGDVEASAFSTSELRMDPVVEGDRVVAMLSGGGDAQLYEGDADGFPLRLAAGADSLGLGLAASASDGPRLLRIETIVIDGYVEDGLLRFDADVELEGEEMRSRSSDPRAPIGMPTSRVRASTVARVDDVAPTGELEDLAYAQTMLGGIVPWERVFLGLSEPVTRASIDAATGSAPLDLSTDELRGQVIRGSIGPSGWWPGDPAIEFPDGLADLIPNVGTLPEASIRRIPEIAPRAGFDFEDGDAGVLRASTGEMFVATEGCYSGSCLAFRHPEGSGRSELFARLDRSVRTIRMRVRVLGEPSTMGTAAALLAVHWRAAGEGSPVESSNTIVIRAEPLTTSMPPYVADSGWRDVTLSLDRSFVGAGVFIKFSPANVTSAEGAPSPGPGEGAAARFIPPTPVPPAVILVDDLEVI